MGTPLMLSTECPPQCPGVSSHISFSSLRLSANEIAGGGLTSSAWNLSHVPLAKVMDRVVVCWLLEVLVVVDGAELRFSEVGTGWWPGDGRLMAWKGRGTCWMVMWDAWAESGWTGASPLAIIERLVASWPTWASVRQIGEGPCVRCQNQCD